MILGPNIEHDVLRVLVLLEGAHDALNFVLFAIIVEELRELALVTKLLGNELDLARVVRDVTVGVHQPPRVIDSPEVLIDLKAKLL